MLRRTGWWLNWRPWMPAATRFRPAALWKSSFSRRSGVRLRLPFGAIHPELNPNWTASWYGLVHIRFSIPGHGVFEDSRDGVRIRPWAPNRDQLEMNTGQRFLPTENLGRRD